MPITMLYVMQMPADTQCTASKPRSEQTRSCFAQGDLCYEASRQGTCVTFIFLLTFSVVLMLDRFCRQSISLQNESCLVLSRKGQLKTTSGWR